MKKLITLLLLLFFVFAQANTVLASDKILNTAGDTQNSTEKKDNLTAEQKAALNKHKIDLYAPFSKNGGDVYCKTPVAKCNDEFKNAAENIGNGCYEYKESTNEADCLKNGGILVQRLILDTSSTSTNLTELILQKYVGIVFQYGLGLGVAFSVIMIVVGGIQIISSAGASEVLDKGKTKITNGILGLALLLLSGLLLHTINPLFFVFS